MEKGSTTIDGGSVEFAMSYRQEIMDDQGLCLQVYAKVDGDDTEILRFDCFDQAPHYHYGPENHNIRLFMDKTTCGTPFGWTMDNLKNNLSTMVERSGYEDLAAQLKAHPVSASVLAEVESKGRHLFANERRTVTHKFERMLDNDIFTVGNIRIGLEYRLLPQINLSLIHI